MHPVGSSYENHFEVTVIMQLITSLIRDNIEPNDIGIIAMFRAQAELIEAELVKLNIYNLLQERDERNERKKEEEEEEEDDEEEEEEEGLFLFGFVITPSSKISPVSVATPCL